MSSQNNFSLIGCCCSPSFFIWECIVVPSLFKSFWHSSDLHLALFINRHIGSKPKSQYLFLIRKSFTTNYKKQKCICWRQQNHSDEILVATEGQNFRPQSRISGKKFTIDLCHCIVYKELLGIEEGFLDKRGL